jgi:hypothetical protein
MSFLMLCVGCSIGFAAGTVFGKRRTDLQAAINLMRTRIMLDAVQRRVDELEQRAYMQNSLYYTGEFDTPTKH